jgi:hypothetical protein
MELRTMGNVAFGFGISLLVGPLHWMRAMFAALLGFLIVGAYALADYNRGAEAYQSAWDACGHSGAAYSECIAAIPVPSVLPWWVLLVALGLVWLIQAIWQMLSPLEDGE